MCVCVKWILLQFVAKRVELNAYKAGWVTTVAALEWNSSGGQETINLEVRLYKILGIKVGTLDVNIYAEFSKSTGISRSVE